MPGSELKQSILLQITSDFPDLFSETASLASPDNVLLLNGREGGKH